MPGGFQSFGGGGGMPGGTHTFHFSGGGGPGGAGNFAFSDPESIFANVFRNYGGGMGGDEDMGDLPGFSSFGPGGGFARGGSKRAGGRSAFDGMNGRAPTPEVTVLERPLPVSLEDIFTGTTKKMKIKRKKYDPKTGKMEKEDRILEVPIKPGLKAGSKIKFKDVGDQVEGGTQDLHFIVEEVSHCILIEKY
jgi:DnaJ family protein B protein 4